MKASLVMVGVCSTVLLAASAAVSPTPAPPIAAATADEARNWPQWRGPLGTGEAPHAKPPLEWSETKNIRWKVAIPGIGKSTPVVWNDLVFVTTAIPKPGTQPAAAEAAPAAPPAASPGGGGPGGPGGRGGFRHPDAKAVEAAQQYVVMALSRADGKVKWQKTLHEGLPHEGTHKDGTFASGSALTDGKRLYAYFGSRGLYALDFTGKLLWEKQLGQMQTRNGFGEGNSPALHGDTMVIIWDHEGADYVLALDTATGKEKWRKERDEPTTWATPHIVVHEGRAQAVVPGTNKMISYDLATGNIVWQTPGLTANQIPSPVSGDGMVYAMGGFRGNMARAVKLSDAKGELTGPPGLVWNYDKDTPYVPSPLLYRGGLYFLKTNSGILTYLDAPSGQPKYTERLAAVPNVYASPVAADGRVYVTGRDGTTVVLAAGPKLEVLATNVLEDPMDSSPALVDGDVFLRGAKNLYRVSASTGKD
jgi:outer membrane protein assembly factor BamB